MKNINNTTAVAIAAGALVIVAIAITSFVLRSGAPPAEAQSRNEQVDETVPVNTGLAAADVNGDGIVYQSGMHPWIVEDEPGQCPICGMDLVPVRVDQVNDGTIKIDPVTLQNIGVRTAPVTIEPMQRMVRTTGRFEANEQLTAAVSPKISGWIEKLYVNYEGARVAKGQPLLEIYSPELVSTQEEYLLALRNLERLNGSPAKADAQRLVEAARRRLSYWDITDAQIRRLEADGTPQKTLTLYAPSSGTVVSTQAVEGQRVAAGTTLMRLANFSALWLMVDVYEQDLSWVGVGTHAEIELPYEPGKTISGKISYIYDAVNPETRTVKARVAVPNPGLSVKPGMYATVRLAGNEAAPLPTVPEEAVVRSGSGEIVVLALGDGRFMPAEVVTGLQSGGRIHVLRGLQGGETVVTSAQFLIDSEARLRSAVGAMIASHDDGSRGPAEASPQTTGGR